MSKVKIEGNASGTGTLTIAAPNTNTDRTLTLPDGAGEILLSDGDGSNLTGIGSSPYVGAKSSGDQTVSDQTATKITTWTEEVDSDNAFSSGTFTVPSGEDGVYFVSANLEGFDSSNQLYYVRTDIYVNGSLYNGFRSYANTNTATARISASSNSALLNLVATDTVEIYAYIDTSDSGTLTITSKSITIFKVA